MLSTMKNRYLAVILVVLALTDVGLQCPVTTPDPLTTPPTQPPESTSTSNPSSSTANQVASSSSASSSKDSSADVSQDSLDSSLKNTEEEMPPTKQLPVSQASQPSSPDSQTQSPIPDSAEPDSPPSQETETTLPPPTSERSVLQSASQQIVASGAQLSTSSNGNHSTASSSVEEFNNLTDEFFQWKLQIFPEFATSLGLNDQNAGHLSELSTEAFEERKVKVTHLLKRAEAIDRRGFSDNVSRYYKIFVQELSSYLKNFKYTKFYIPVNNLLGPHNYLVYVVSIAVLETQDDYLKLLSRYNEFPRQIKESITVMKTGVAEA